MFVLLETTVRLHKEAALVKRWKQWSFHGNTLEAKMEEYGSFRGLKCIYPFIEPQRFLSTIRSSLALFILLTIHRIGEHCGGSLGTLGAP